jgi:hypothetical protein
VTRPGADLSHESLAYRLELLEQRPGSLTGSDPVKLTGSDPVKDEENPASDAPEPPPLELRQLQEAWQRSVLAAVEERSIPAASMYREAHPVALVDDLLTVEFPGEAEFHRKLAEDQKNTAILRDALYDVTGRRLTFEFTLGDKTGPPETEEKKLGESELVALFKEKFDAKEVDPT